MLKQHFATIALVDFFKIVYTYHILKTASIPKG